MGDYIDHDDYKVQSPGCEVAPWASGLSDKFPMLIVAERFASILGLCQD